METPDIQVDTTPTPEQANAPLQALGTPQAPSAPAPAQATAPQAAMPATPDHQANKGIFQGILAALGGSTSTSYEVDPNSGAIKTVSAPSTPGQQWKTILAGALSGLAAGAGTHGPAGVGEAVSRGFAGGMQAVQQNRENQRQQAVEQSKDITQAKLNQASFVKQQQDLAKQAFELSEQKTKLAEDVQDKTNKFSEMVSSAPGAQYRGFYSSFDDLLAATKDPQQRAELIKEHADGTLVSHVVVGQDKGGNPEVQGVEFFNLPKQWLTSPTEEDVTYTTQKVDPKTGKVEYENHTIPAGRITNAFAIQLGQKEISGAITPKQEEVDATKQSVADTRAAAQLEVAAAKINAQAQKYAVDHAPIPADQMGPIVDLIGQNRMDANTLRYYLKNHPEVMAQVATKYPDWSEQTYKVAQKALESYASGKNGQNLQSTAGAVQHLADLHELVSKLPTTTNSQTLNRAIASLARQMGNTNITNVDTLAEFAAGETAKAMTGGVPDKDTLEQIRKNFTAKGNTIAQIRGAIEQAVGAAHKRLDGMAGNLEGQVPGLAKNKFAPRLSPGAAQAFAKFGYSNPFDFASRAGQGQQQQAAPQLPKGNGGHIDRNTAQQYLQAAGGDPNKARTLAAQNGWKF